MYTEYLDSSRLVYAILLSVGPKQDFLLPKTRWWK